VNPIAREFASATVAVAGIAAAGLFLNLALLPALGVGAVGYLAARMFIPGRTAEFKAKVLEEARVTDTKARIIEFSGRVKKVARRIEDRDMSKRILQIGQVIKDMTKHFDRDPRNVHQAGDLLELHLPRAVEIVERYGAMVKQPYLDDRAKDELAKTESTIELIEKKLQAHHGELLSQDREEMAVDRLVFEQLLSLDEPDGLKMAPRESSDRERG